MSKTLRDFWEVAVSKADAAVDAVTDTASAAAATVDLVARPKQDGRWRCNVHTGECGGGGDWRARCGRSNSM